MEQLVEDQYASFQGGELELVRWHVWDLAGRPETPDDNWGGTNAKKNIPRLLDAMALTVKARG